MVNQVKRFTHKNTIKNEIITVDSTLPTGYVRVRIDCESKGAVIKYNKDTNFAEDSVTDDIDHTADKSYEDADLTDTGIDNCMSYYTSTTVTINENPTFTSANQKVIFLGGNDHQTSCKQYIVAKAELNSETSALEKEGIFRTVLHIVAPVRRDTAHTKLNANRDGYKDVSVRGTTGFAGEPSISPFPLRDSQVGSPFLRRAFNAGNNDYYWVSFEILVNTSFSGYFGVQTRENHQNVMKYDWSRSWGILEPGEFTRCTNMRGWAN